VPGAARDFGRSESRAGPGRNRGCARRCANAENLFDARLAIVRDADLEKGGTRLMHDLFFASLARREEAKEQAAGKCRCFLGARAA
jgi:hypothetical protein